MANLELPFGIKVLNPTPADAKYLNNGVPYANVTEANTEITAGLRHTGLTVNIDGVEYWYASGTTDGDLVIKGTGGLPVSGLTAIENVGSGSGEIVSGISGNTGQFRTIVGSGDTTVSTVGDEVIIYSESNQNQLFVTTGSNESISASTINATYVASGTTGYTLSSAPITNTKLTFIDGLGSALSNNIEIDGNGKVINGASNATINTDYGSITILYNGINWNVISFVS